MRVLSAMPFPPHTAHPSPRSGEGWRAVASRGAGRPLAWDTGVKTLAKGCGHKVPVGDWTIVMVRPIYRRKMRKTVMGFLSLSSDGERGWRVSAGVRVVAPPRAWVIPVAAKWWLNAKAGGGDNRPRPPSVARLVRSLSLVDRQQCLIEHLRGEGPRGGLVVVIPVRPIGRAARYITGILNVGGEVEAMPR